MDAKFYGWPDQSVGVSALGGSMPIPAQSSHMDKGNIYTKV